MEIFTYGVDRDEYYPFYTLANAGEGLGKVELTVSEHMRFENAMEEFEKVQEMVRLRFVETGRRR